MVSLSLPRPSVEYSWASVHPRPLRPVVPSTYSGPLPAPPCPPRPSPLESYALSTHIVAGVLPRSTADVPLPPSPPLHEDKVARQRRTAQTAGDLLSVREKHEQGEHTAPASTLQLWNCIDRYVRTDYEDASATTGLTLFFAHANGMHKETFEPTIQHLISMAIKESSYQIDEIWTFDAVQHGDSALLNETKLGALFDWTDNARDILNFFLHYVPQDISVLPLPTHLEPVAAETAEWRRRHGFSRRRVVLVGHSYGGCSLTHTAYHFPAMFSGLVLLDPVVQPIEHYGSDLLDYVIAALSRRSFWSSREEAYRLLKASPFFRKWDDGVLRMYVDRGMADTSGGVRLKCSGVQEAVVYADTLACWEAWMLIPSLDPRIALKWIVPPHTLSVLKNPIAAQARVWRRPLNSSHALISTASHLIVQDSPREVAEELHIFLCAKVNARL